MTDESLSRELPTVEEQFKQALARREAWEARLKEPLSEEDLDRCPVCECGGVHWLREIGKRHTWQPMSLALDPETGLMDNDYLTFDYGDDVEVECFECSECMTTWPTLVDLHHAIVSAKHAGADADWFERVLTDEVGNALAAVLCDSRMRLALEQYEPALLAQAREALGLPDQVKKKEESNG